MRRGAAESLGKLGDPRAVEPLVYSLEEDINLQVRESAALALGKLGDPRAVEPLVRILREEFDHGVREKAAVALGDLGDSRALKPLIDAVRTDAHFVGKKAAESLHELTGRSFGVDGDKWMMWWLQKNSDEDDKTED